MVSSSDGRIAGLVLVAAGSVLAAPVLGRMGAPSWADAAMILAAGSGFAAFVLAAIATVRAGRRAPPRDRPETDS